MSDLGQDASFRDVRAHVRSNPTAVISGPSTALRICAKNGSEFQSGRLANSASPPRHLLE